MGVATYNVEAVCDHATPEKFSSIRLHMDLPFSHEDFQRISNLLSLQDWQGAEQLACAKYPHLKETISSWMRDSENRALGRSQDEKILRVVNG
ncbi:hypothetical protein [Variovorax paradoxus]|uniref:hypothetical protein n=1 Tax=Variovorax paradoxus TaxID=34073 RepID=UPI001ABCFC6C